MIFFRSTLGYSIMGRKATILGWGNTDKGNQSCDLLKADTKVTPERHFNAFLLYRWTHQNVVRSLNPHKYVFIMKIKCLPKYVRETVVVLSSWT